MAVGRSDPMSAPRTPLRALPFDALKVPLDPGITLVEASAGTGKTFAITRLVLRLLLERKVESLSRILVVTFTEMATQELVTRIRKTLRIAEQVWSPKPPASDPTLEDLFELRETHGDAGREIVLRALGSLDDLAVSTIHGFCHRMLAESALESGIPFRTTFVEDDTEAFGRAANDWARRRLLGGAAGRGGGGGGGWGGGGGGGGGRGGGGGGGRVGGGWWGGGGPPPPPPPQ